MTLYKHPLPLKGSSLLPLCKRLHRHLWCLEFHPIPHTSCNIKDYLFVILSPVVEAKLSHDYNERSADSS